MTFNVGEWVQRKRLEECAHVINLGQIPNTCSECVFLSMLMTKHCNLVNQLRGSIGEQVCEIDDFIRYALENL